MPVSIVCPVCRSSCEDAFVSEYVSVGKCTLPTCGHLFATNVSGDHGVQSGRDDYSPAFDRRNQRLLRYWAAKGFVTPDSRVLDVGAGQGHVSRAVREVVATGGGSVCCVEPDEQSRLRLVEDGFEAFASVETCRGTFSAIILVEVIEHVTAPVEFLRSLDRLLTANGRVFLTTPCGETNRGKHNTNAYETPEHVQFFTERSLRRACSEAGLHIDGFRVVNAMYPAPTGLSGVVALLKDLLRPIRGALLGPRHLVSFVERTVSTESA
jgi:2-polyprenyl-3-methyl-5-hydroxy-6-metoxy-1,4-benzoquinol methylase